MRDPNWYFYWSQTRASVGNHRFSDERGEGYFGWYKFGDEHFYIGPPARTSIDEFARTCLHENRHLMDWLEWWGKGLNAYDPRRDQDGDYIPDDEELALGYCRFTERTFAPGEHRIDGQLVPGTWKRDFGHRGNVAEMAWRAGSADREDWANPGAQSNK